MKKEENGKNIASNKNNEMRTSGGPRDRRRMKWNLTKAEMQFISHWELFMQVEKWFEVFLIYEKHDSGAWRDDRRQLENSWKK